MTIQPTQTEWRVSKCCQFCGDNQITPTSFSGLFKLSESALQALEDSGNDVTDISAYFEITICESCLNGNFNGDIATAITECSKSTNSYFTAQ